MSVVIAGSTGLAGSALMRIFENAGHEVLGLNRSNVNLLDYRETKLFFESVNASIVIDAAAHVGGIGANNSFPVEFLSENIKIQTNLMQAAHETSVERFIFLGSSCIYPRDCPQPIKEEYLLSGPLESTNSAYAIAKIAGIELINSYRKEYGKRWVSVMPTNLYGPKDNFSQDSSHVLPALIRRFSDAVECGDSKVSVWGSGSSLREFLHVDDMARAVLTVANKYDSTLHLNIGSGREISIKELALKIADHSGFKGDIVWDKTKPDGTPRKILDSGRIISLGWKPIVTLEEGIRDTISWYREQSPLGNVRK
jgi:GDP-L-fucose synthase